MYEDCLACKRALDLLPSEPTSQDWECSEELSNPQDDSNLSADHLARDGRSLVHLQSQRQWRMPIQHLQQMRERDQDSLFLERLDEGPDL